MGRKKRIRKPLMERFFSKVLVTQCGCWIWLGGTIRGRYGKFSISKDDTRSAYKWIYEQVYGKVPEGLELDHVCKISLCVNPNHLEPVTKQVNNERKKLTHCKRGHEFVEGSFYNSNGLRNCKECVKERDSKRSRLKK